MPLPESVPRRTFIIAISVALSSVILGCGSHPNTLTESEPSSLAGKIQWTILDSGSQIDYSGGHVFGAAFLLLEEHYKSLGFKGPPAGYPRTKEEALKWHRRMPDDWWSDSSIPYDWWGRKSGIEPIEVTLPLAVPVHLLRAHLDSSGSFEFKNIPLGRHTLFIRWGKNPDPQDNVSGPFAVVVEKPGRIDQVFPVSTFDMIST
ncbi:MAG: hypothetical protein IT367_19275 [Candidatus Hydrogenedentes bacterium]|nr:hypothetical protein [Candidatus Hydrogenedentota bacterium]